MKTRYSEVSRQSGVKIALCALLSLGLSVSAQADVKGEEGTGSFRASGGPDSFGYTFSDSAEVDGPTPEFVDISATGTPVFLTDDAESSAVPIGFPFPFYGLDRTQAFLSSNGALSFESGFLGGAFTNDCPFIPGNATATVAAYWDDLDPFDDGAAIYYQTLTPCPIAPAGVDNSSCFVAHYDAFDFFPGDGTPGGTAGSFEILLFPDGKIQFQYGSDFVADGSSATIGINLDGAGNSLTAYCNTAGSVSSDFAVQFNVLPALGVPALNRIGIALLALMAMFAAAMAYRRNGMA